MLLNHKHVNKEYNEKEFKDVRVNGRNDIDSKAAQKDDKVDTKSKKGLVHRQPRMGIDLGSKHNAPGGDSLGMMGAIGGHLS